MIGTRAAGCRLGLLLLLRGEQRIAERDQLVPRRAPGGSGRSVRSAATDGRMVMAWVRASHGTAR